MTNEELVAAFLNATTHLSDPEAAGAVGVTHTTIGRWKEGYGEGWKRLHAQTRRKLLDYLREHGGQKERNGGAAPAGATTEAPPPELGEGAGLDLRARLAEIEALEDSEGVRTARMEALAAVIRADAARAEAQAAIRRAEAAQGEARAAEARAEAQKRAEDASQERARSLVRAEDAAARRATRPGPLVELAMLSAEEEAAVASVVQEIREARAQGAHTSPPPPPRAESPAHPPPGRGGPA